MKIIGNKKIISGLVMIITAASVLLAGCGFKVGIVEDITPDSSVIVDENLLVIGFSQLGSESVWRTADTESIQDSLSSDDGYFLIYKNARQKQENQIKAIRNYISRRVDYIIFSPVTAEGWDTVLQEAKEADVPVIIVDRSISTQDDSLYTTWVGSNTREEGEKAGRWLEQYLSDMKMDKREEINIVVLQGTTGSSAQIGRTIGFDSIADKHPNWRILEQTSGDFTTARGKEVMKDMIRRYENIDVVVSQNDDMTFGAIEAMDEAGMKYGVGTDTCVISFDAVSEALSLVKEGKINVDVECNPLLGPYIADIISRLEDGEVVDKKNYVEETVFTIDNVTDELLEGRTY